MPAKGLTTERTRTESSWLEIGLGSRAGMGAGRDERADVGTGDAIVLTPDLQCQALCYLN